MKLFGQDPSNKYFPCDLSKKFTESFRRFATKSFMAKINFSVVILKDSCMKYLVAKVINC